MYLPYRGNHQNHVCHHRPPALPSQGYACGDDHLLSSSPKQGFLNQATLELDLPVAGPLGK